MRKQLKSILLLAIFVIFIVMGIILPVFTDAEDLDPPELPVLTMHTLENIYDKLDQIIKGPAPVEKTGQETSLVSGDDGSLERGVAWPNPRFTDNGDGTVTDNLTRLIWLKHANCFGGKTWSKAIKDCKTLNNGECGLSDGSDEGNWRLPNIKELHSLIHYGIYNPAVPNTTGTGKWTSGDPFTDVQSSYYWSSSSWEYDISHAWYVFVKHGGVVSRAKSNTNYVWPVRGGN